MLLMLKFLNQLLKQQLYSALLCGLLHDLCHVSSGMVPFFWGEEEECDQYHGYHGDDLEEHVAQSGDQLELLADRRT